MDYAKINEAAMGYKDDMTKFLRDLVRIPGESCGEKGHIMRIKEEMEKVGFDKVQIDPMGNILGYMGTGKTLIGFDAHIDTVGIGNIKNWLFSIVISMPMPKNSPDVLSCISLNSSFDSMVEWGSRDSSIPLSAPFTRSGRGVSFT